MKYLLTLALLTTLTAFQAPESFYSMEINNLEGRKMSLKDFQGKKILIVILPVAATDTTISIEELSVLQKKYINSLVVIGVLAEETGYSPKEEKGIKNLYRGRKPAFSVAEGMKVKKEAGAAQSKLFQWLTSKEKNRHFDQDIKGVGHKFFVDEQGELYAVMGPQIKLSNPVIDRILSKPLRKTAAIKGSPTGK